MPQVNAQVFVDALHRLEEQQDLDTISGLYAQDADISNPVVPHEHQGPQGARQFWQAYRSTFQTIRSEFHHVLDNGKAAMLEWTSRGRANDGAEFSYRGVSVLEYDDSGIHAFRAYFDPRHLGEQLTQPHAQDSQGLIAEGFEDGLDG